MTYRQAGMVALAKRVAGWIIFLLALISTLISLLKFCYALSENKASLQAVLADFIRVFVDMIRFNTPWLNSFWRQSPLPTFTGLSGADVAFWLIYCLIFVGLALAASGARMSRQLRYIHEGLEDQLILENAKGETGLTREQLEEKIVIPRHSILTQYFPLYVLPVLIVLLTRGVLSLAGLL